MELKELKELLYCSWEKETCSPSSREHWTDLNPSIGQCAITALIVNDFFGGKIMRCMTSSGSHYYNIVEGKIVDLTKEQFKNEIPQYDQSEERSREYLLSNVDTRNRYKLLLKYLNNVLTIDRKIKKLSKSD